MSAPRRLVTLAEWGLFGSLVGVACGGASALFLWLLELVTTFRVAHEEIVWSLPVGGLLMGWVHERFGHSIKGGNNLVVDTIHDGGPQVPVRMAPLVLLGTVFTHLLGGSAGREGTAVQIGASLADWFAHRINASRTLRRYLLVAGVAGGFGSVFGTPLAGAVFACEFLVRGRFAIDALVPAVVAATVGDFTTRALGTVHTPYPEVLPLDFSALLLVKWVAFAVAVALVTTVFIELTHFLKRQGERRVARLPLRMALGGALVVVAWRVLGTGDYLGLGIPTILRAFHDPQLASGAFLAKLLLTAITLGAGFLGGEVTPLFFVGATLGSVLARGLNIPLDLGAGVGMAAVFAAAANTPLALSIMAAELLGLNILPHVLVVSALAYWLSGRRTIYTAQRQPSSRG